MLLVRPAVRDFVNRAPDLDGEVLVVAHDAVDVAVGDVLDRAESARFPKADLELVDLEIALLERRVGLDPQLHLRSFT